MKKMLAALDWDVAAQQCSWCPVTSHLIERGHAAKRKDLSRYVLALSSSSLLDITSIGVRKRRVAEEQQLSTAINQCPSGHGSLKD